MEEGISVTDDVSLINVVGNKVDIQGWKSLYSLPDDDLSIENGIILQYTKRWPLCIDPQLQANTYIKKQGQDIKKQFFKILKATDDKISSELEKAIRNGWWVMIEGVTEKLSSELEPVLNPQIKQKGKIRLIKFGEKEID
jgi:dynein heavy chain